MFKHDSGHQVQQRQTLLRLFEPDSLNQIEHTRSACAAQSSWRNSEGLWNLSTTVDDMSGTKLSVNPNKIDWWLHVFDSQLINTAMLMKCQSVCYVLLELPCFSIPNRIQDQWLRSLIIFIVTGSVPPTFTLEWKSHSESWYGWRCGYEWRWHEVQPYS